MDNFKSYATGLLGLAVGGGVLSPPFDRAQSTGDYTVTLPANASAVHLTLAVLDGATTPTVNGQSVPVPNDGDGSFTIAFPTDQHEIKILVQDKEQHYTLSCRHE